MVFYGEWISKRFNSRLTDVEWKNLRHNWIEKTVKTKPDFDLRRQQPQI